MKVIFVIFIFILVATINSKVLKLSAKQFYKLKKSKKQILVYFYMTGCQHCKELNPIFQKLDKALTKYKKDIPLVMINGPKNIQLRQKYNLRGFPAILLINNNIGMVKKFQFGRTVENFLQFLVNENIYHYKEIDEAKFEKLKEKQGRNYVVMSAPRDSKAWKMMQKMSNYIQEISGKMDFYMQEVQKEEQIKVTVFWKGQPIKTMGAPQKMSELFTFRKVCKLDNIIYLTPSILEQVEKYQKGIATLIFVLKDQQLKEDYQTIVEVKKIIGSQTIVCYILEKDRQLMKEFESEARQKLGNAFYRLNGKDQSHIYPSPIEGKLTVQAIIDNHNKMLSGNIPKIFKSLPIPQNQTNISAPEVVGDNYNQEVEQSDKHVIIFIFWTKCGHCKLFSPVFQEVAQIFQRFFPDLKMVTYNGIDNDYIRPQVSSFPAIAYQAPGQKLSYLKLQEKTVSSFINVIKKNKLLKSSFDFASMLEIYNDEIVKKEKEMELQKIKKEDENKQQEEKKEEKQDL